MRLNWLFLLFCLSLPVHAQNETLEARLLNLSSQLRCLVCQNQSIADSDADLAIDLKNEMREMLRAGQTDEDILKLMTHRYGDFVLYNPPFKAETALLWMAPFLGLLIGALSFWVYFNKREKIFTQKPPQNTALAQRLLEHPDE